MQEKRFTAQWGCAAPEIPRLKKSPAIRGIYTTASFSLLRAHEDKSYPGAFIASLSIPWGEAKGDPDQGGYHLVWTRDMVNSASAMFAAGDRLRRCGRSFIWPSRNRRTGAFPRTFGLMGGPTGRGSSSTKSHFQFF